MMTLTSSQHAHHLTTYTVSVLPINGPTSHSLIFICTPFIPVKMNLLQSLFGSADFYSPGHVTECRSAGGVPQLTGWGAKPGRAKGHELYSTFACLVYAAAAEQTKGCKPQPPIGADVTVAANVRK